MWRMTWRALSCFFNSSLPVEWLHDYVRRGKMRSAYGQRNQCSSRRRMAFNSTNGDLKMLKMRERRFRVYKEAPGFRPGPRKK